MEKLHMSRMPLLSKHQVSLLKRVKAAPQSIADCDKRVLKALVTRGVVRIKKLVKGDLVVITAAGKKVEV
jgi:hypothetical protein